MTTTQRLAGKVAIVTGGASGIGAATVRRFRAEGAEVLLCDLDTENGERVALESGATFHTHDVTSEQDWQKAIDTTLSRHGRLDVVVNNAGIVSHQDIAATTLDSWHRVIAVNLTGSMLGCRFGIEVMRNNPGGAKGSLVNVGSTTSFLGLANDLVYTTTKSGIVGLTRSVATWCALNGLDIRCNSLHPGATRTEILRKVFAETPGIEAKVNAMSPTGRMAEPDEIASLALYLASDDSSYSTGAQFLADGGLSNAHPVM
jgi:NAD(P)-dependent dehydrogenase (short-subunit alcohol dehydrogenase family)